MEKMIAILEGDGIGPEITREGIKVLRAIEQKYGHKFKLAYAPFGASAYFSEGSSFPAKARQICDDADAIIKGPIGLSVEKMKTIPIEHRPEKEAILALRERYDTFANYRPITLPVSFAKFSPLKPEILKNGLNIMMIRELVGGIYFGDKIEGNKTNFKYASDNCVYTEKEIKRIAHIAFKEAREKKGPLTNVHKANILSTSRFWNKIVEDISSEYPEVEFRSMLVDNAAYQLVKNPTQFNGVMLLENMQGDILTDQAGGILGSLGLMPSACMGPEKGYVEPAHGSAPDIAGKNIANPYSMIGSIAFMLEKCFSCKEKANIIWNSLTKLFEDGYSTQELKTQDDIILTTEEFGSKIVEYVLDDN